MEKLKQIDMNFEPEDVRKYEIDHNFQTPKNVCSYMASLIPKDSKLILEPTPGFGNLVRAIEKTGFTVFSPENFFAMERNRFDCIVMNPPFSRNSAFGYPISAETKGMKLGYYILKECMEMSDNVIALMPWYTIADSDVRLRYLKKFGIKSLTHLPRSTFKYARIQTTIIELEKGYQGKTIFESLI